MTKRQQLKAFLFFAGIVFVGIGNDLALAPIILIGAAMWAFLLFMD